MAPSQITPTNLRPSSNGQIGLTLPQAQGLQPPAGAEKLVISLGDVDVTGDYEEQRAATRAIVSRIAHRRVTLAEIYAVANAIEKAYAEAGFPLARVVVPAQRLRPGGPLKLVVVDGAIEDVDVSRLPARQQAVVRARLAPLIGKRRIRLSEIERRLLLAADDPGLTLTSTLTAGKTPGGSLLVLQGAHAFVTGSIGVNDYLPRSLGSWSLDTALSINSPLGFGEQAYLSASLSPDLAQDFSGTGRELIVGGGFVLPLGIDGFAINPEATHSVTRAVPAAGAPPSEGVFDRFDLRALYPIIRSRAQTLTVQASLEWAQERLTAISFPVDLYLDRYQAARIQLSDQALLPWGGTTQAVAVFSQGLGGRGTTQAAVSGVPLSQLGASPNFSKLSLDWRWQQPLPLETAFSLIARGQTSFGRPLFVAEQISLDGPDAASGFPSGVFIADEGFTARGELSRPVALAFPDTVATPYLFGEAGRGFIDQATAVQSSAFYVASYGAGLRVAGAAPPSNYGGTVGIELARGLVDAVGQRDDWRVNFIANARF